MNNDFGGIKWTNHALQRMRERNIKQGDAWTTWRRPDQSRKGKSGKWVYYKTYGDTKIEVVATQNEKKEWVVLSVWSKKVFGEKPKKQKDSLLKTIFKKLFKK